MDLTIYAAVLIKRRRKSSESSSDTFEFDPSRSRHGGRVHPLETPRPQPGEAGARRGGGGGRTRRAHEARREEKSSRGGGEADRREREEEEERWWGWDPLSSSSPLGFWDSKRRSVLFIWLDHTGSTDKRGRTEQLGTNHGRPMYGSDGPDHLMCYSSVYIFFIDCPDILSHGNIDPLCLCTKQHRRMWLLQGFLWFDIPLSLVRSSSWRWNLAFVVYNNTRPKPTSYAYERIN